VTAPDRTAEPGMPSSRRRRLRVAHNRHADPPTPGRTAAPALDRVLELLERSRLSATELRILVALLGSEMPVYELAETLGRPSVEIRREGGRLYVRGLLRWRHDAVSSETVFGITRTGLATLRPLLTAAAGAQGVHSMS